MVLAGEPWFARRVHGRSYGRSDTRRFHLAMRGAPLKVVQELMGHATIQMTMRYAHLYPEVAREHVMLLGAPSVPRGSGVAAGAETTAN